MDQSSELLPVDAIAVIGNVLQVQKEEIVHVSVMKRGMTNHSFSFECHGKKYMIRIAGEGTDRLINRKQEYEVYQKIVPLHISDKLVYFDVDCGYKITEYLDQARVCDAANKLDVRICMRKLRDFHERNLQVSHTFDMFGQIRRYESLWEDTPSCFTDYTVTKDQIFDILYLRDKYADNALLYQYRNEKELSHYIIDTIQLLQRQDASAEEPLGEPAEPLPV